MKWFLSITARLLSGNSEQKDFLLPDCATHLLIIKESEQILDSWFWECIFEKIKNKNGEKSRKSVLECTYK